MTYFVQ